jgi:hypothetical protein
MDIFIISAIGALLGALLASGSFGQKITDGIFSSARRACKLENLSIKQPVVPQKPDSVIFVPDK